MSEAKTAAEARQKLWDMIKDIKFAMFVTQDTDGSMFSRPMVARQRDAQDQLWFMTAADSPKVQEIKANSNILLSYATSDGATFVSITGRAEISKDPAKIEECWSDMMKAWFPKGKTDPNICLIKVDPQSAEYWDQPSSKFVQAFGYLKAKVTGHPEKMGENKIVGL